MIIKCPFPKCNHRAEVITKVHCRTAHSMEREDVFKKYGKPTPEKFDNKALRENKKLFSPYYPHAH